MPLTEHSRSFTPFYKGQLKYYIKAAFLQQIDFPNRSLDLITESGTLYRAIYEPDSFKDIKHKKGPFTALCSFQVHHNGRYIVIIRAITLIEKEI